MNLPDWFKMEVGFTFRVNNDVYVLLSKNAYIHHDYMGSVNIGPHNGSIYETAIPEGIVCASYYKGIWHFQLLEEVLKEPEAILYPVDSPVSAERFGKWGPFNK